jgi:acetyl-CoA carboxylase carboxyltransferase component
MSQKIAVGNNVPLPGARAGGEGSFWSPARCAVSASVGAIIQPRETRKKLIQALAMLENKRDKNPPKKHGNIPL